MAFIKGISLTNLVLLVCLAKVAFTFEASGADVAALTVAVANYMHRRFEANKSKREQPVDLKPIQEQLNVMKANQEMVFKNAEETKKVLSQSNLAGAFAPRK